MRALLLALALLVTSAWAGCAAQDRPTGAAPTSSAAVVIDPDEDLVATVNLTKDTGAVVGRVLDDVGYPLRGTHVALLRTDWSNTTDQAGVFQLPSVPPGDYTMRVDRRGYRAVETPVHVEAGNVTRLKITLLPLVDAGAGYRHHTHDYWLDRTEVTVIDGDFRWIGDPQRDPPDSTYREAVRLSSQVPFSYCVSANGQKVESQNQRIWFDQPDQLVWAGTGALRIRLDWTQFDYGGPHLNFAYRHANTRNFTVSGPVRSGETLTVAVNGTMWDNGHQRWTLWDFFLCRPMGVGRHEPFVGKVHVRMDLVRGEEAIPFEPPHPRFWAAGPERTLINQTKFDTHTLENGHRPDGSSGSAYSFIPPLNRIVPPGTSHLDVRLNWSYSLPYDNRPLGLAYRTADQNPWSTPLEAFHVAQPLERGPHHRTYRIGVMDNQTDAFYQRISTWLFFWGIEGEERSRTMVGPCPGTCVHTITLSVVAVHVPGEEPGEGAA